MASTIATRRLNERVANPNPSFMFIEELERKRSNDGEKRLEILRALAAQVKKVCERYKLVVNSFEEAPWNGVFAGRNWNHGECIEIVLKTKSGHFMPSSRLVNTLCHELSHVRHMNHGPEFQKFMKTLQDEVHAQQYRGDYGDGFWSAGSRLNDGTLDDLNVLLAQEEFPQLVCDGAKRGRAPRRRRRAKPLVNGVASNSSGAQTVKQRKAGGRNDKAFESSAGGNRLDGKKILTQEEKRELSSRLAQDRKDQAALSRSAKKKNGKKGRAAVATDESESDVDLSPSKRKAPSTKPGISNKKKARLDEDESESEDELDSGEESEGAQSKKAKNTGKAKGKAKPAAKRKGKEKAVGKGKKKFGSGGTLGGAEGALAGSTYRKRAVCKSASEMRAIAAEIRLKEERKAKDLPTSSDVEQEDEEEEEESDDEIIELDLGSEDEDGGGDPGESAYEQYLRERKRDLKAKNGGEDGLFMSEDEGFDSNHSSPVFGPGRALPQPPSLPRAQPKPRLSNASASTSSLTTGPKPKANAPSSSSEAPQAVIDLDASDSDATEPKSDNDLVPNGLLGHPIHPSSSSTPSQRPAAASSAPRLTPRVPLFSPPASALASSSSAKGKAPAFVKKEITFRRSLFDSPLAPDIPNGSASRPLPPADHPAPSLASSSFHPPPPPLPHLPQPWACSICTFENVPSSVACEMQCGGRRPFSPSSSSSYPSYSTPNASSSSNYSAAAFAAGIYPPDVPQVSPSTLFGSAGSSSMGKGRNFGWASEMAKGDGREGSPKGWWCEECGTGPMEPISWSCMNSACRAIKKTS